MKIKDGLHLPTKKFPENFDGIFRKQKMKASRSCILEFLFVDFACVVGAVVLVRKLLRLQLYLRMQKVQSRPRLELFQLSL